MNIWKKMNYTAQIPIYRGSIWEYDMVSAGFSVAKASGMLSSEEIEQLSSLPKYERNVSLGLMMRNDTDLLDAIELGIRRAVKDFCKENEITRNDIISIKRDAIFSTRKAQTLDIEGIMFREDNKYSSFYLFNRAELFWNTWDNNATWKGLGSDVVMRDTDYFLAFIVQIIKGTEVGDAKNIARKLIQYRDQYINLQLNYQCYRECNKAGKYRHNLMLYNSSVLSESFPGFDKLNPIYNYKEFILPLIAMLWRQN